MRAWVIGTGAVLIAGFTGLSSRGIIGGPGEPASLVGHELTTQEVLAERSDRQAAAQEVERTAQSPDMGPETGLVPEAFRQRVEFDYPTLRSLQPDPTVFVPDLQGRVDQQGRERKEYLLQEGHPRFYQTVLGKPVERIIYEAIRSDRFEYGHMVRLEARSSNLIPGVLISPGSEDQFIIHEDLFESMLSQVTSGRTLDPELQPWSDVPVWDAQADNLVFMESNPELLTRHMLAEHLVGTSRELCSYINPRRSGFSQSSLGQPGGLTDFTAGKGSREEPERVTDVVALDIEANVEEILRHAPERLDIPTEVRFPVTLSYNERTGAVESVDPTASYLREADALYRCGSSSRDKAVRNRSLASLVRGMQVTGLPVAPAIGGLPGRPPRSGWVIFGEPLVTHGYSRSRGDYRAVQWTPLRIDLMSGDGHGFNTGYVASFDYREGRYYRIVRERDQDGSIIERKDNIGGRNE
ncbi:hypothetical protein [Roseinatronobacter sp. NSM]|uniref:hypothetical protein n=1 Tax=Roseinatronobacter sp. NSM TaxID=3457785 RepID=UPI004036F8D8